MLWQTFSSHKRLPQIVTGSLWGRTGFISTSEVVLRIWKHWVARMLNTAFLLSENWFTEILLRMFQHAKISIYMYTVYNLYNLNIHVYCIHVYCIQCILYTLWGPHPLVRTSYSNLISHLTSSTSGPESLIAGEAIDNIWEIECPPK